MKRSLSKKKKNMNDRNEIEDKMGFKFKDLELIGYGSLYRYWDTFYKILLYKYKDKFLIFKIYNENNIHSIAVVTNIQKSNFHSFSSFKINNDVYDYEEEKEIFASEYNETMLSIRIDEKNYYYKTKEVLLIDENLEDELQYYYTFLCYGDEDKKEVFSLSEPLELEDEENVIIVLLGSFFDDSKI